MPINLESTLQGIRRGAAAPGVPGTLAGQIRAQKQKQKKQQFEMQRGLQELMMDQAATQSEMRRRAAKTSQEQQEGLNKKLFGVTQRLATVAQQSPDAARQMLANSPRIAQTLGIDPRDPNFVTQIQAVRDKYRAQVAESVPDPSTKSKQQTSLRLPDGTQTQGYFDPEDGKWYAKTDEGWEEAPPGTMEITAEGSLEDLGITEKTKGALEEEILKADKAMQRLSGIQEAFDPAYQESWTRLGFAWDAAKEKAGFDLTNEEEENLSDFSAFKQRAANNINLYIKEITGAQMSEAEADRLRKSTPDPGDGIFDGDSPTQFRSKMEESMEIAKAIRARAQWALENGLMSELEERSQKGDLTGKFDLDNFMEEKKDDPVEKFINDALGL